MFDELPLEVKIYLAPGAQLPKLATAGSAGYDVCALENTSVFEGRTTLVKTGIFLELPVGIVCQIYPRSGLATKHGIIMPNSVGILDSDYRGELMIAMSKLPHFDGFCKYDINRGERIAQIVFSRYERPWLTQVKEYEELSKTDRGTGGFGSTGIK